MSVYRSSPNVPPPTAYPPVLLSIDYRAQRPPIPAAAAESARYQEGQLRVVSSLPDGNQGVAADQTVFADVIVQAQLSMSEGADDDLYGLFVRSPSSDLYYTFATSPSGQAFISMFEGEYVPLASGPLDPDLHFAYGLGQPNVFSVVAVGPSLTFILNGRLVGAEIVDDRYFDGYLGFYVHHGTRSVRAELAADWIQVRGVFPSG
jgi:hypothetical protein